MKKQISVLVVDDDEGYSKEFISYARCCDEIAAAEYALNGEEGLELLAILKPEVVVLDVVMPRLDGIGFLRKMKQCGINYKPVIIMNSSSVLTSMLQAAARYGVDYFMIKPQRVEEVCKTAFDLAQSNIENARPFMNKEVEKEDEQKLFLKTLGIPMHLSGYKFISSAIKMAMVDPEVLSPITKRLYPMIADKFNTNKACVERAIRHAISVSWQRGNKKLLKDIFGYSSDNTHVACPTNTEYIAMVTDDYNMKLKYNIGK